MQSQIVFLLKILLLSAIVSLFIKYVMPYFAIAPTSLNAAIAVLIPPIVVGALLLWRDRTHENQTHPPTLSQEGESKQQITNNQ